MKSITIDRSQKGVTTDILKQTVPGLLEPGTIYLESPAKLRRVKAGEVFMLDLISPTGKTKVMATAFHNGMGMIQLDGQSVARYVLRNGTWKAINSWWNN